MPARMARSAVLPPWHRSSHFFGCCSNCHNFRCFTALPQGLPPPLRGRVRTRAPMCARTHTCPVVRAQLWDITAGKTVLAFDAHRAPVTSVAFHPIEFCLASTSVDRCAKVWDLNRCVTVGSLPHEIRTIRAAKFAPDGACARCCVRVCVCVCVCVCGDFCV